MIYLLQSNYENEFITQHVYNAYISLLQKNWLENEDLYYVKLHYDKLETFLKNNKNIIPVGSVEFIEEAMRSRDLKPPEPYNIPDDFKTSYYTSRNVYNNVTWDKLVNYNFPLFVKPDDNYKSFTGGVFKSIDQFKMFVDIDYERTLYFVSDPISIESEFRILVHNQQIRYIAQYIGLYDNRLSMEFLNDIVENFGLSEISYSFDVGICNDGTNVLIEFHHFYGVGTYGFEGPEYINMLTAFWKNFLKSNNND